MVEQFRFRAIATSMLLSMTVAFGHAPAAIADTGVAADASGCAVLGDTTGQTTCSVRALQNVEWPGTCDANGCSVRQSCSIFAYSTVPGNASLSCYPGHVNKPVCPIDGVNGHCYDGGSGGVFIPNAAGANCVLFGGSGTVTNPFGSATATLRGIWLCYSPNGAYRPSWDL